MNIDSQSWARLEALFSDFLKLEVERRARALARLESEEPAMAAELREMLAAHDSGEALEIEERFFIESRDDPDELVGTQLGPYRLAHKIGEGGMGSVYLAEREGDFRRRVAVKILRPGWAVSEIVERFRAERQILARLEHPDIAQLLDGGETADGRPYLVLQYVEGEPITAWCEARRTPLDDRLALFRTVCAAIQFAHGKLVVHRDLKPSNILVTAEGEVRLLDFGIAKLLDPSDTTAPQTRAELRLMTPEHAAPEQIRGEEVTTATDVYALGALLYQLLAGRRPFGHEGDERARVERAICEEEPPPPSVAAERPGGSAHDEGALDPRRLRGDLDAITLKAMQKEPQRRYASAGQLAEDVERYLSGMPVLARRDTRRYRLEKFVRRHAAGVAATALVLGLTTSFYVWTVRQARVLAAERNLAVAARAEAERHRQEAQEVTELLIDLFEASDPFTAPGGELTARQLLERGEKKVRQELAGEDPARAALLHAIGRVYGVLKLPEAALPLLEEALALRRGAAGDREVEIADTLTAMGAIKILDQNSTAGLDLLREALEIRERRFGSRDPRTAEVDALLAEGLRHQALLDEADTRSERAVTHLRAAYGPNDRRVFRAMNGRAMVLRARQEPERAKAIYAELVESQRRVLGPDDPNLAVTLNNLAFLLRGEKDWRGAEPLYRESLEVARRRLDAAHPFTQTVTANLAAILMELERYDEVETLLRHLVEIRREALSADDWRLGQTLVNGLGRFLLKRRRFQEAEDVLREGMGVYAASLGADHPWTAAAGAALVTSLVGQGRLPMAMNVARDGLAVLAAREKLDRSNWLDIQFAAEQLEALGAEQLAAEYRSVLTPERRPPGVAGGS